MTAMAIPATIRAGRDLQSLDMILLDRLGREDPVALRWNSQQPACQVAFEFSVSPMVELRHPRGQ